MNESRSTQTNGGAVVPHTVRQLVKKGFAAVGLEVFTAKGRMAFESGQLALVEEYLQLLAKSRGIAFEDKKSRTLLLSQLVGTGVGEGSHIVACLESVKRVDGDVCEFGVGSGATSALIANEIRNSGKVLWLYDTFAGLPAPTAEDTLIDDIDHLGSMSAYAGRMSHGASEVLARLAALQISSSAYRIVPGLFDTTITDDKLPERVSFAYVDFDFYAPIKAALEKLLPRLSPGATVMVDDYGFFSEGAQLAVDQFVAQHQECLDVEIPDICRDKFIILRRR